MVSTGSTRRLKDHLGSASVVTDASGNIVGEQRYYLSPRRHLRCASTFGETRLITGTLYTDKLFTRWIEPVEIGQRQIAGLGIYHYQSRFYSPKLGRFLSADSLVPNPFNAQDYNRYSYVRNNPLRYTDPSGHMCSDPDDPTPTCDNSFLSTTKVGNKVVKGSGLDAGKPKVKKKTDDKKNDPPSPEVLPDGGVPESDAPVVNANPDPLDGGLEQDDYIQPTNQLTEAQQLGNFFEAFDILSSIAEGGFFFFLTIAVAIATCAGAGVACIIVLPIYYFMAVMFLQHGYNGYQEYRRIKIDPSVDPTGREAVDFFLPFLKKEK